MDKKEYLIEVRNLSKKYCKDLKTSLHYGLVDSFRAVFPGKHKNENVSLRSKEFWALRDISFNLKRGECIGLVGHNGAGKSTLLKIINGLIKPDTGFVKLKGKVGALIELGAGFNPILTGRENIYNNAAVLGFSKQEVDKKINSIIAFSEIEEFIDSPVQNYSSGMKVRLGFAVAIHLEPDILLVDEVLAVGDLGFVLKCFKKMDELLPKTAVVFVSHSMPMVSRMCNQIIVMDHGKVEFQGSDVGKGIDMYYSMFSNSDSNVLFDDKSVELQNIVIRNGQQKITQTFDWNDSITIELEFKNLKLDSIPYVNLSIYDKEQRGVAIFKPIVINRNLKKNEVFSLSIHSKNLQLSKGKYSFNLIVFRDENQLPLMRINNLDFIIVKYDKDVWPPFMLDATIEEINSKKLNDKK